MLISRVIWPRVLLWNNKIICVLIIINITGLCANLLFAQQKPAILERGPYRIIGIDILGTNAINAHEAVYSAATKKIIAIYTKAEIIISPHLVEESYYCNDRKIIMLINNSTSGDCYYYSDSSGFSLFFIISSEFPEVCNFIDRFITQFIYFLHFRTKEIDVPFPAIVDFTSNMP